MHIDLRLNHCLANRQYLTESFGADVTGMSPLASGSQYAHGLESANVQEIPKRSTLQGRNYA
jgi:hypothetical protein